MSGARPLSGRYLRRRAVNALGIGFAVFATVFGLFWLAWILWTTLTRGAAALSPRLFTQMTPPPGAAGGLLNAFFGSFVMLLIAIAIGTPLGIGAGTYLSEYAVGRRIGGMIRFVNDILLSAPSIVIGLFCYTLLVQPSGHFSGWAGGVALALLLLPVVVRSTDETLRLIPATAREAVMALGVPKWRMITLVLYRAARAGLLTGLLLGIARISGETAPLLFTALNNQYWTVNPASPMANIPVVIFQYALSPYQSWHALAWAGALIMTVFVLLLSVGSRLLIGRRPGM
jgi:phosphate transport system permease protein